MAPTFDLGCVARADGVACSGDAWLGLSALGGSEQGPGANAQTAEQPILRGAVELAASDAFVCSRSAEGRVSCAGRGVAASAELRAAVSSLSQVIGVAASDTFACALTSAGTVHCWGPQRDALMPPESGVRRIGDIDDAVELVASGGHACARRRTGAVVCWGEGNEGQLGHGRWESSTSPVAVVGIENAIELAATASTTCARLGDGTVSCWGDGRNGELGDDRLLDVTTATPVLGLPR